MEWTIAAHDRLGIVRERSGNRLPNSAPLDNYVCSDGEYVCIAAAGDVLFPRLCAAMENEALLDDERFASLEARAKHADEINDVVAAWARQRSADEVEEACIAHQVPVSRVYAVDEIVADPHVQARGSIVEVDDPELGPVKQQAPVPRLDRTPLTVPSGAPRLGEHTDEVLTGLLGLSPAEIAELRADGVV
jgi:crotonobetainyl-CoA:carnitine CoA-transferase CaiB-like acyl-CoA transferase